MRVANRVNNIPVPPLKRVLIQNFAMTTLRRAPGDVSSIQKLRPSNPIEDRERILVCMNRMKPVIITVAA